MRRLKAIGALNLTVMACLLGAVSATAAPGDPFVHQGSIDGSGIPGGIENPQAIAVNHATGNILVYEHGVIDQYDPEGNPVDFAALGSPTLSVGMEGGAMAVDNTGGPTQGNIYLIDLQHEGGYGSDNLWSYSPDGSSLGATNPHNVQATLGGLAQAIGVLPDGTLELIYLSLSNFTQEVVRTDQAGVPVGPSQAFSPNFQPAGPFVFDEAGNLYAQGQSQGALGKYPAAAYTYAGETGLPLERALAVDPSTSDVYLRQGSKVRGVHFSEPLVESTPFEAISGAQGEGPIAFDASGQTLYVAEGSKLTVFHREPIAVPRAAQTSADGIGSSHAVLHGGLLTAAQGTPTTYHFEYGLDTNYGQSTPELSVPFSFYPTAVSLEAKGLQGGSTYHVRIAASSANGTSYGPDATFRTYPAPIGVDTCANALARKQTAAQRLLDCRAYELASASDTGGYDVESYLAPGQTPFPGFPFAKDRVLYATHAGAVPGPWNATNKGPDPYVATRTANGWVTDYKGLPADLNPNAGLFSSVLGEADSSLGTLAFAGPNLCDPCFTSGLKTGIPLRLPSGQLIQGMTGSLAAGVDPSAKPEGKVAKYFSQDGKHLLFASKYAFEPGANDDGTTLTVYDRNLATGTTQIVSTDHNGAVLNGTVSGLDVSADGSRIVTATKTGEDPAGNEYVHPYLHVGSSPNSVDLAPGTTSGALFGGMTSDGSKAFFTTKDPLVGDDTDNSADLYQAAVDSSGNLSLSVITEPDIDACNPVANANGEHWNTGASTADCSAVAISGGGGVAPATGAIYFLSPESFGGKGTPDQPNLYLAQPGGSPSFVATLEPGNPLVLDSVKASASRETGDFQTTPNGSYAAFTSSTELTGVHTFGFRQVFRFDATAGQLTCASCDTTETTEGALADDVELAPDGLSLLSDGRLFFTTRMRLVLSDTNARKDVYEWKNGEQALISSGTSRFDSALLSASADGTDVFFFTHDVLAPEEDKNGQQMKIYDAREGGGFFKLPQSVPCQASDECHGPSSAAPAPPDIKSSGKTTQGNFLTCPKNRVKKRGQCVKKPVQRKKKKHAKKKGTKKRNASTTGKRGGRNA